MSDGVTVTVNWTVKADRIDETIDMLRSMFPVTRLRNGFRNIRLLRSEIDGNSIILLEEWNTAQDFHDYIQFRTDTGEMASLIKMAETPPQIGIWTGSPLAQAQSNR
jgi:heme-degrading monooxygenase HmoA